MIPIYFFMLIRSNVSSVLCFSGYYVRRVTDIMCSSYYILSSMFHNMGYVSSGSRFQACSVSNVSRYAGQFHQEFLKFMRYKVTKFKYFLEAEPVTHNPWPPKTRQKSAKKHGIHHEITGGVTPHISIFVEVCFFCITLLYYYFCGGFLK